MSEDRQHQTTGDRSSATLLVFTLEPARERARRRLLPGRLGSWEVAIYHDCLDAALAAGRASGCSLSVCAPRRLPLADDVEQFGQEGSGFGDRLRRAVARHDPAPARPLVVVGSDAPGLEPRHVAGALERLGRRPDRLVVGPSPDGGFYLLAAAFPVDDLLAEVAWRRRGALSSLLAAARARGIAVSLLTPLADLDRRADLDGWLARHPLALPSWLRALAELLRRLRRPPRPTVLGRLRPGRVALVAARGPPS